MDWMRLYLPPHNTHQSSLHQSKAGRSNWYLVYPQISHDNGISELRPRPSLPTRSLPWGLSMYQHWQSQQPQFEQVLLCRLLSLLHDPALLRFPHWFRPYHYFLILRHKVRLALHFPAVFLPPKHTAPETAQSTVPTAPRSIASSSSFPPLSSRQIFLSPGAVKRCTFW